jgi:hypothetical protein
VQCLPGGLGEFARSLLRRTGDLIADTLIGEIVIPG